MSSEYRPSRSSAHYLSCPHITIKTVTAAQVRLACLASDKVAATGSTHVCLTCSRFGSFEVGTDFRSHFEALNHTFGMRASPPHEIYCMQCADYQFCSLLDVATGRKRPRIEPTKPTKLSAASFASPPTSSLPRGLVNMGSTCFMNSALQVLCSYRPLVFSEHLSNHVQTCSNHFRKSVGSTDQADSESDKARCIPCEFRAVTQALWSNSGNENGLVIPSDLLFALWTSVDYMAGYSQQDAHEFLIAFLSYLEMQLSPQDHKQLKQSEHFNKFYSGTVRSTITCGACGYRSSKNEQFVDLNLSVDASVLRSLDGTDASVASSNDDTGQMLPDHELDLTDCLRHFTISEHLAQKMHCPDCNDSRDFLKQLSIVHPPELLILHLKRFDFMRQKKIYSPVKFALEGLNLRPYMVQEPELATAEAKEGEAEMESGDNGGGHDAPNGRSDVYNLQGVVCHTGSLNQGHYISYIRGNDPNHSQWIRCDDERISLVSVREVERAEGYLLFYARSK